MSYILVSMMLLCPQGALLVSCWKPYSAIEFKTEKACNAEIERRQFDPMYAVDRRYCVKKEKS